MGTEEYKMEEYRLEDYKQETRVLPKNNRLIDAKYKANVTELKLQNVALYELARGNYIENGGLQVSIKASFLKELFRDANNGSFYRKIKDASKALTGRVLGIEDPEKKSFHYMSVITNADYENGVLSVTFNSRLKDMLTELSPKYTRLDLLELLSYESAYSTRIAELLESRMYTRKGEPATDKYKIEFGISEFYLLIGLVNSELAEVQKILNGSNGAEADYDRAVAASPEKIYSSVSEVKRRVINPVVKEINENELNHLYIDDVEYGRSGRGGKITSIRFYVRKVNKKEVFSVNEKINSVRILSEEEREDFLDDLSDLLLPFSIKAKERRQIAEISEWNMERIQKAITVLQNAGNVESCTGFLIKAIRENWNPSVKKNVKNDFHCFQQNDYDFVKLENELIVN